MQQHDQRMEDVAMEIARYLCANPDAGDTAEGVRHWWLTGDNAKVALNVVYAALNELLLQGTVKMRESADGTRVYSGRVGGQCE